MAPTTLSPMYAILAYTVLALVLTWPLAAQIGDVVPKDLGDPLLSTWMLWWNAHVLPFSDAWWHAPFFFPSANAVSFSDHRVGIGLITTPIILAGASPLAAYGVAVLASFVLSAGAAYALCLSITGHRLAAFVGGLVFGFHPFRATHLEHLELLASYWLPIALLFLHRWSVTRSGLALIAASLALTLQALTSGYYFFFALVLLLGWVVWFVVRGTPWRQTAELGAALVAPVVVLAPILWRYRQAHQALGLSRDFYEIQQLSADVSGLWAPPQMLAFWNSTATVNPEAALFPGVTAVCLVIAALWRGRRSVAASGWWRPIRLVLATVAIVAASAGLLATIAGPMAFNIGPIHVSVSGTYKPLSVALLFGLVWLLTSARVRDAWRRSSPFAFYVLATLAMWMLAFGPTARLFGTPVIYKAPYAWLMVLPGFADAFRAPARFAMLAALTLSVAAAIAVSRLVSGASRGAFAAVSVIAVGGVLVDSWIERLPLPAPPPPLSAIEGLPRDTLVLELPLGIYEDAAAMYRSMGHGRRLVNGLSGFEPPHYTVLRRALLAGRLDVLTSLVPDHDLAIVVHRTEEGARVADALARLVPAATRTPAPDAEVFRLPRQAAPSGLPDVGPKLRVVGVTASVGEVHFDRLGDGDMRSGWHTPSGQAGGEQVVIDLGSPVDVAGLELGQGKSTFAYPGIARIDLSLDGSTWASAWEGDVTTTALRGALAAPALMPVRFTFAPASARFVRITQLGQAEQPWAFAELAVFGPPPAGR